MTVNMNVPGATFKGATAFASPISVAPLAWYLFGAATLPESLLNLADNSLAQVVGAPVLNAGYISLKGNAHFLQTALPEMASETTTVVMRSSDTFVDSAHAPVAFGTYASSGDAGVSLLVDATATVAPAGRLKAIVGLENAGAISVAQPNAQVPDLSQWRAYSLVVESGVGITIHDLQTGLVVATFASALPRRVTGRTVRIGSTYASVYTGAIDLAALNKFAGARTATERGQIYARLKISLARRGIAI